MTNVECVTEPTHGRIAPLGGVVLTKAEKGVLGVFREFLVTPGQMLCFCGPRLKTYRSALRQLAEKELVVKEEFKGGYSLTPAGFAAMKQYK